MAIAKEPLPPPGWGLESIASVLEAFPRGQLSEIVGPRSAGGSSLLTALLARATAAGAELRSLCWVRGGGRLDAACRAAELLARCGGFAWVALDLAADLTGPARTPPTFAPASWIRLQRAVRDTPTRLIVHASRHLAGSAAALVLAVERGPARWMGSPRPRRLDGLGSRVRVLRARPPAPTGGGSGTEWVIAWRL